MESPRLSSVNRRASVMVGFKLSEANRWGQAFEEVNDPTKLDYGSYLDADEKMRSVNKTTRSCDQTRWGNAEFRDDTTFEFGSYLDQMQLAQQKREQEEREKKEKALSDLKKKVQGEYLDPETHIFSYHDLRHSFPKGVNPTKKEMYLSDEEFEKVFKMDYDRFIQLSTHQQSRLKKSAGLF